MGTTVQKQKRGEASDLPDSCLLQGSFSLLGRLCTPPWPPSPCALLRKAGRRASCPSCPPVRRVRERGLGDWGAPGAPRTAPHRLLPQRTVMLRSLSLGLSGGHRTLTKLCCRSWLLDADPGASVRRP